MRLGELTSWPPLNMTDNQRCVACRFALRDLISPAKWPFLTAPDICHLRGRLSGGPSVASKRRPIVHFISLKQRPDGSRARSRLLRNNRGPGAAGGLRDATANLRLPLRLQESAAMAPSLGRSLCPDTRIHQ